jgi:hypothetical protein
MSNVVGNALNWFAGAFYVIVALAIVYLYFFKLVPLVLGSVKTWTIWDVFRITFVLGGMAILLGYVAVFTGDWIFSQVFDTLPKTRMARELSRVSGANLRLSWGTAADDTTTRGAFDPLPAADSSTDGSDTAASTPPAFPTPSAPDRPLKDTALGIWAAALQTIYNPTGNISDNIKVMNKRDIPQGVTCDVFAESSWWWPYKSQSWQLLCSDNSFKTTVPIQVNGTAARGLTGGSYYKRENPFTVYGTGRWPDAAYDMSAPTLTPTPGPSGGPLNTPVAPGDAAASAPGDKHIVAPGENLAIIAKKYGVTVQALVAANVQKYPRLQQDQNVIVAGWTLNIPAH